MDFTAGLFVVVLAALRKGFTRSAPPAVGTPLNNIDRQGAFEYGKLAIGSLITTSAGSLVAFLAFVAQVKSIVPAAADPIFWGVGLLGCGLMFALFSALLAYMNQAFLAFWGELSGLLWLAVIAVVLSAVLTVTGAGVALFAARGIVEIPVTSHSGFAR